MGLNVHPCQVGDELLEPILLDVEQQATLALVVTISEMLGAEEIPNSSYPMTRFRRRVGIKVVEILS